MVPHPIEAPPGPLENSQALTWASPLRLPGPAPCCGKGPAVLMPQPNHTQILCTHMCPPTDLRPLCTNTRSHLQFPHRCAHKHIHVPSYMHIQVGVPQSQYLPTALCPRSRSSPARARTGGARLPTDTCTPLQGPSRTFSLAGVSTHPRTLVWGA